MKKIKILFLNLSRYSALFIISILYPLSAYALIPEMIDKIVEDINVWVFIIAAIFIMIGIIFKSTRRVIFGVISAVFAVYMTWTVIHLSFVTDIY